MFSAEEKHTAANGDVKEELYIKNNFPSLCVITNIKVQSFSCVWDHWPKKAQVEHAVWARPPDDQSRQNTVLITLHYFVCGQKNWILKGLLNSGGRC